MVCVLYMYIFRKSFFNNNNVLFLKHVTRKNVQFQSDLFLTVCVINNKADTYVKCTHYVNNTRTYLCIQYIGKYNVSY